MKATLGHGPRGTRPRNLLFRGLAVALGLAAGLAATEAALRVLRVRPPELSGPRRLVRPTEPGIEYACYPSNPHGEFRRLPDLSDGGWKLLRYSDHFEELPLARVSETPWCVEVRVSEDGLRDRRYPERPEPGALRILGMGDSFAMGAGVPVEHSLFKQMELLLGAGYEVLNGAQVDWDTSAELAALQELVPKYHATRAVIVFLINDVQTTPDLLRRRQWINDLINVRYSDTLATGGGLGLRLLDVFRAQADLRRTSRETIAWYRDCYRPELNGRNLGLLASDLRAMASLPSCRAALVLYPILTGLDSEYPFASIHAQVTDMSREAGLPVLDLTTSFQGMDPETLWVHSTDRHPNGRAHAVAAGAITRWLKEEVPGFLNPDGSPEER